MNHYFSAGLPLFCVAAAVCSIHAAEILPYKEALEKARTEKKALVVLSDGSDWLPCSAPLNKAYKAAADKAASPDVIWAVHDEKNVQTEESRKAEKPPVKVWSYPALQILDPEGRPLYFKQSIKPSDVAGLSQTISRMQELQKKRDEFWQKAAGQKGPAAAESLFKGLSLMDESLARHEKYKPQRELIKKEDPSDSKGYYLRYTYHYLSFMEKDINKAIEEKKYADAYKAVDEKLRLPALSQYQKQQILSAKFRIAKEEGKLQNGLNYLKQVVALGPDTEYGKGARNLIDYYTRPVKLEGLFWTGDDNRPVWLPMVVDVSSAVKGGGTFEIEFKHKGGHTKFRNPAFKSSSGKVLASLSDMKEGRNFTLTLPSGGARVLLEVESQGTGWFDGRGDIVITKK